jgi:hypothetical protein
MKLSWSAIIFAFALIGLSACKFERAAVAKTAQTQMVGMSRHDVLLCAGVPERETKDGTTDFMTYVGGGDSTSAAVATANGSSGVAVGVRQHRYCEVTFVLDDDKVVKVNYAGRTGGYATHGEQCAFVVQNCVK